MTEFIFTTKPYHHQEEALHRSWGQEGFALFLEQGTGKSKIIVDEVTNLIELGRINCVIVAAPNNVHINWKEQFETHGPPQPKWEIQIYKSELLNNKKFEDETRRIIQSGKVLVFLVNIEALSAQKGFQYVTRILKARRKAYMVIDESHKIKNPSAIRTKNAILLGKMAAIRRIATGTEAQEGLENLYSQFKFLGGNILGFKSFTAFKSMFCNMGGFENRMIVSYRNEEVLARKIAPFTYNKRKHECLDLPDKVYQTFQIDMTPQQRQYYDTLEEELLLELASGQIVDATMAVTRMIRLQQVLSGHLKVDNETIVIPSYRASFIASLADQADKSIIFCRFIKDVELMLNALANEKIGAVGITGQVDISDRMADIDRWRKDKMIRCLVMTIGTGGVGLTLNESHNTIFYNNSWSSTDRLQAEDRNHRIGQNDKVTYSDIIVPQSIDVKLLKALRAKENLASKFRGTVEVQRWLLGQEEQQELVLS